MKSKKILYLASYFIIIFGLLVSGYLLIHHFETVTGQSHKSDLCTLIFNKGCSNASFSSLSNFLNIPLGGWGIIYFVFLATLIAIDHWLPEFHNETIRFAFWVSFTGVCFSLYYFIYMVRHPIFFCPFCALFHILNFTLFFFIKKLAGSSYSSLLSSLFNAFQYILLGKPLKSKFENWKWLAFALPLVISLVLYQWVRIQGLNQTITRLAKYDPLEELEKFEAQPKEELMNSSLIPVLGPKDAAVTLVVFTDFQCSNCKMFASNFHQLIKYNQGKLKIHFKYFPLNSNCNSLVAHEIHKLSCKAAYAAQAAQHQGKFWEYHDSIFAKNLNDCTEKIFFDIARTLQLNMNQFTDDFNSNKVKDMISNNVTEGIKLEIDGTPCAFLNGRRIYDLRPENISFLVKYLSNNLENIQIINHKTVSSEITSLE